VARRELECRKRGAYRLVGIRRSVARYTSRRENPPELLKRLRGRAGERRRYGYSKLAVLLQREGFRVNYQRAYQLYNQGGLLMNRTKRKKTAGAERGMPPLPVRLNQRWSMDRLLPGWACGCVP
jgi:putative transposase